jgi:hypothetical protein
MPKVTTSTMMSHFQPMKKKYFRANGVFNEADTLESSSLLIYSESQIGLYTQLVLLEAALIKH